MSFSSVQKSETVALSSHTDSGVGSVAPLFRDRWPPEAALLLASLQAQGNALAERARPLVRETEFNWGWFHRQVLRHGVAGLVYDRLAAADVPLPESTRTTLRRLRGQIMQHNMARMQALIELLQQLEARGIPALPFKGPVLAAAYYDDLAERHYGDLDLLVHRDDILRIKALLIECGYVPYRDLTPEEEQAFIDRQLAYEFVRETDNLIIELHWALMHDIHAFRLRPAIVWEKARTTRLGGHPIRTLATEDLVLYLAAHGSKHGWYRLLWACDMDRVIRAHTDADWERIMARARQIGSARSLRLGLFVAHRWLGTPLPPPVVAAVQRDDVLPQMAAYVEERWLFADLRPKDDTVAGRARYFRLMRERWRDRLAYYRHLLRLLVTPTDKDRAVAALPERWDKGYYLIRPYRLLRDALRRIIGSDGRVDDSR